MVLIIMDYRKIYIKIIRNAKNQNRRKGDGNYYEQHHILPKSLFPLWAKRKSNLVLLTAREHFFVHELLTKIYPSNEMSFALFAFINRPNADYKIGSRTYEKLRRLRAQLMSEYMKGNTFGFKKGNKPWNAGIKMDDEHKNFLRGVKRSDKARENISKAHIGKSNGPRSEETKRKISKANKGRVFSEEARRHMSEGQKGKTIPEETRQKIKASLKKVEHTAEWNKKVSDALAKPLEKPVMCVETGDIFYTSRDICNFATGAGHWREVVSGKRNYAGKLPDGTKLTWKYVELS